MPARACCQLSELRGMFDAAGGSFDDGVLRMRFSQNTTARKSVRLAHMLSASAQPGSHFRRGPTAIRPSYRVELPAPGGSQLAQMLEVSPTARACCRRAYLRGAFLATGTASATGAGYHLEVAMATEAAAARLATGAREAGVRLRTRAHRGRWVAYLKGSDDLGIALAAMGASQAVLAFENQRILRDVRGRANRQVNTETANMRRVVVSGIRQLDAAAHLRDAGVLDAAPAALREVAATRLAMPGASLQQIADRLGLSKSAVNGRMRRLEEMARAAGLVD